MKHSLGWLITVVLAAIIQTTWLDVIKLQGVLPDLTLLLVVYFAIAEGEERAMWTAVIGGVYQDVSGNYTLGHNVLTLVIVGYTVGRVSTRLITEHPAVKAGLVLLAAVAHGLVFAAILYFQEPNIRPLHMIGTAVIPGAFYTAVLTPVVFFALAWVFHRDELARGGAI
jgi:rod shape-determining protein MreD